MSIFRKTTLGCPACQTPVEFEEVHSLNADRRPDLRLAILDDTFQQEVCPKCSVRFRLDPAFNLMDTQRGQWIAAAPLTALQDWKAQEQHARKLFDRAYGPEASAIAQEIGVGLKPRITFGWPALREKVLVSEHLLDDVVVELCKALVMRNSDSPISAATELRLVQVLDGDLIFAWLKSADEARGTSMRVARKLYDEVATDNTGDWDELKGEFEGSLFVDLNRMMISGETPAKPPAAPPTRPGEEPAPAAGSQAAMAAAPAPAPEEKDEAEEEAADAEEPEAEESDDSGKKGAKKKSNKKASAKAAAAKKGASKKGSSAKKKKK
jgi:hypothetical protein